MVNPPLTGKQLLEAGFAFNGAVYSMTTKTITLYIDLAETDFIIIDDKQGGQIVVNKRLNSLQEVQNLIAALS